MSATIYLWCYPSPISSRDVQGFAMDEEGEVLAMHLSSNPSFSQHDLGLTSDWKHDKYRAAHPEGFELVWVDDPDNHEGFRAALAKNHARPEQTQEGE